jgi:hypothetical protein
MEAGEAMGEGEGEGVEVSLVVLAKLTRTLPLKVKANLRDGARMLPRIQPRLEAAEEVIPPTSAAASNL